MEYNAELKLLWLKYLKNSVCSQLILISNDIINMITWNYKINKKWNKKKKITLYFLFQYTFYTFISFFIRNLCFTIYNFPLYS